jgi:hypothetical protein
MNRPAFFATLLAIRKCTGDDTKKCATSVAVGSRFERRKETAAAATKETRESRGIDQRLRIQQNQGGGGGDGIRTHDTGLTV